MDRNLLACYADLIVSVGANVQEGQVVSVEAVPEARPLVVAIAERAYEVGARYVDVQYFEPLAKRARVVQAPADTLEWVPPWLGRRLLDLGALDAARILLDPRVPPNLLADVDPARASRERLPRLEESTRLIDERSVAWTLSACPTAEWARLVYPDVDADAAVDALWQDIAYVCRLDEPDPAAAWRARIDDIWESARRLDELGLDALHFEGPGTDLTVGLLPSSRFAKEAGAAQTRTGIRHVPNLPTEEVFTTPDPERTHGVVAATKPLDLDGTVIDTFSVRFEHGRAVEIDAEPLAALAAVDDGAARLGEVALVDNASRIGRLGRTFYSTLLDENAASHVALGNAYISPVSDDADRARVNKSSVHIDFMIGSPEVSVTGTTTSGEHIPLLAGGEWQLP
ncbi:MAG TPA: aminopeptidase [Gaiellaceae bacterium]|nr:aminopeptidase [Gaiellaceae bacterium]